MQFLIAVVKSGLSATSLYRRRAISWEQRPYSSNQDSPCQCLTGFTYLCDLKGSLFNIYYNCSRIRLDGVVRTMFDTPSLTILPCIH